MRQVVRACPDCPAEARGGESRSRRVLKLAFWVLTFILGAALISQSTWLSSLGPDTLAIRRINSRPPTASNAARHHQPDPSIRTRRVKDNADTRSQVWELNDPASSEETSTTLNMQTKKQKAFTAALTDAKRALESVNLPFHLACGTALGARRENRFILFDEDIDLQVFRSHWGQNVDVPKAMQQYGFEQEYTQYGTLEHGLELSFWHTDTRVKVDVFLVYNISDRHSRTNYFATYSYVPVTLQYPKGEIVYDYRPYEPEQIRFAGQPYCCPPESYLEDAYGLDWMTPRKFGYFDGIANGLYSNIKRL